MSQLRHCLVHHTLDSDVVYCRWGFCGVDAELCRELVAAVRNCTAECAQVRAEADSLQIVGRQRTTQNCRECDQSATWLGVIDVRAETCTQLLPAAAVAAVSTETLRLSSLTPGGRVFRPVTSLVNVSFGVCLSQTGWLYTARYWPYMVTLRCFCST